jgi:hypothetical protein
MKYLKMTIGLFIAPFVIIGAYIFSYLFIIYIKIRSLTGRKEANDYKQA